MEEFDFLEEDAGQEPLEGLAEEEKTEPQQEETAVDALTRMAAQAGLPDDLARRIVLGQAQADALAESHDRQAESAQAQEPFLQFVRRFPQADVKTLPDEVYEAALTGGDMAGAYLSWQNARLAGRVARLEADHKAGAATGGSALGDAPAGGADEGWQSFLSAGPGRS